MTHNEQRYPGTMTNTTATVVIDCTHQTLYQIFVGAAFGGTTLTVQKTDDGVNFYPYKNAAGTVYTITVAANSFTLLPPLDFLSVSQIQLTAAGNQTADIPIVLYGRDLY